MLSELSLSKLNCTLDSPFTFHFLSACKTLFSLSSLAFIETQFGAVLHFHWTRPFTFLRSINLYLVQVILNLFYSLRLIKIILHRICRCFIKPVGFFLYSTLHVILCFAYDVVRSTLLHICFQAILALCLFQPFLFHINCSICLCIIIYCTRLITSFFFHFFTVTDVPAIFTTG